MNLLILTFDLNLYVFILEVSVFDSRPFAEFFSCEKISYWTFYIPFQLQNFAPREIVRLTTSNISERDINHSHLPKRSSMF